MAIPRTMRRIANPYRAVSLTSSPGMYIALLPLYAVVDPP
jgi:hypothetical protein